MSAMTNGHYGNWTHAINNENSTATENIKYMGPLTSIEYPKIITSIIVATRQPRVTKRANHHNSDLNALPEKSAYFLKQVLIDV